MKAKKLALLMSINKWEQIWNAVEDCNEEKIKALTNTECAFCILYDNYCKKCPISKTGICGDNEEIYDEFHDAYEDDDYDGMKDVANRIVKILEKMNK